MSSRRRYLGAYTDDRGTVRPITARRTSSAKTGLPLRTKNSGANGSGSGLDEEITLDGVTLTRRQWLERDATKIYVVDGKPSLSQYFYVPVESYQPTKKWTESDLLGLEEREARAEAERKRAYEEWLNREPNTADNALTLLSATRMSRRDRKVWEGMEAQLVAYANNPNTGRPLTPKQEKYIIDIARRYQRKMRITARSRGESDPTYLEAYRDVFEEDPLNG